jgi:ABC-type transporter Mla MlaB component
MAAQTNAPLKMRARRLLSRWGSILGIESGNYFIYNDIQDNELHPYAGQRYIYSPHDTRINPPRERPQNPRPRVNARSFALPPEITPDWVSREHGRLLDGAGNGPLELDCRKVVRLDTLALAWLAQLQESLSQRGGKLVLKGLSPEMKKRLAHAVLPETGDA